MVLKEYIVEYEGSGRIKACIKIRAPDRDDVARTVHQLGDYRVVRITRAWDAEDETSKSNRRQAQWKT